MTPARLVRWMPGGFPTSRARSPSLAESIFRPFASVVLFTTIAAVIISYIVINSIANEAFMRQLGATQTLFADNLRRDLLAGDRSDVYRKCKGLLRQETVLNVKVTMADGTVLCDLTSEKNQISEPSPAVLTTRLNFDDAGTSSAGMVRVAYSNEIGGILKRQGVISSLSVTVSLFVALFWISRRLSQRLSAPMSDLCQAFLHSDLETIDARILVASPAATLEFEVLPDRFRELLAKLAKYRNDLVQAERSAAIATMMSMLAHDVRKPFSILRIGLGMLGRAKDPEGVKRILSKLVPEVEKATTSVDGLIADVMEVSSTSTELIQEPSTPESLIESSIGEVFCVYPKAEIEISYEFGHTHLVNVHVNKVARVFSNIVGNAVQAMNYRGAIWFRTSESDESTGMMQFCLGNSGSFIPPENLPKLFEAFFTSGKKGGTGLGLAIAEKVVKAHGGRIWCESRRTIEHPDGIVEFYFTLPIAIT